MLIDEAEGIKDQIKENQNNIDKLYNEIRDFSGADYVKTERVAKRIQSLRSEINSLTKKIMEIDKQIAV